MKLAKCCNLLEHSANPWRLKYRNINHVNVNKEHIKLTHLLFLIDEESPQGSPAPYSSTAEVTGVNVYFGEDEDRMKRRVERSPMEHVSQSDRWMRNRRRTTAANLILRMIQMAYKHSHHTRAPPTHLQTYTKTQPTAWTPAQLLTHTHGDGGSVPNIF